MISRFTLFVVGGGVALGSVGCDRTALRNDRPSPQVQEFPADESMAARPFPMPVPPPPPPISGAMPPASDKPDQNLLVGRDDTPVVPVSERPRSAKIVPASAAVSTTDPDQPTDLPTLLANARTRFAGVVDFTARLVKREVVGNKPMPTEEAEYRFRQQPFSVYLKVTSDAGLGREVLYVRGRDDRGLHLVTGKGDHFLRGFKTVIPLTDPRLTEKSRYRADEAGFGRTLAGLTKAVGTGTARLIGPVTRPEYPYPLTAVEVTIIPHGEPQLPKGGTRQVFFDPHPDSPSYLMPVLVVTQETGGREVEYYLFDRVQMPAGLTDADFDPARLKQ